MTLAAKHITMWISAIAFTWALVFAGVPNAPETVTLNSKRMGIVTDGVITQSEWWNIHRGMTRAQVASVTDAKPDGTPGRYDFYQGWVGDLLIHYTDGVVDYKAKIWS